MTTEKNQSGIHPLQKFEAQNIHRSLIKEASYNPRAIEADNDKRLRKNIETRGLLETLVWNKLTGNLVSGHRRLEKLDKFHQKKFGNLDYYLTVAVVELSEKEEKEQNIFFNNQMAQGYFDMEAIKLLVPDIDTDAAGFTAEDLEILGIEMNLEKHENTSIDSVIDKFENIKQESKDRAKAEKESLKQMQTENPDLHAPKDWKETKKEINQKYAEQEKQSDNWVTISFDNHDNKAAFMQRFGKDPNDKYLKGEILSKRIEIIE